MSNSAEIFSPSFRINYNEDIAILVPHEKAFMRFQAKEFDRIFELLRKAGHHRFILDFSACDYISSEGLTSTASCWKWCHDEGNGHMAAIISQKPDNEVMNLFEIIGLSRMIGNALQPTLVDALKYMKEFA
jgi:anti-anti-sigma regulatory factor